MVVAAAAVAVVEVAAAKAAAAAAAVVLVAAVAEGAAAAAAASATMTTPTVRRIMAEMLTAHPSRRSSENHTTLTPLKDCRKTWTNQAAQGPVAEIQPSVPWRSKASTHGQRELRNPPSQRLRLSPTLRTSSTAPDFESRQNPQRLMGHGKRSELPSAPTSGPSRQIESFVHEVGEALSILALRSCCTKCAPKTFGMPKISQHPFDFSARETSRQADDPHGELRVDLLNLGVAPEQPERRRPSADGQACKLLRGRAISCIVKR